jgi:uncharacterized tellurite resistance protein B-like protein
MLDGLRHFIADVISPTAQETRSFDDTGYRLAATALLIHVISLDGEPSEVEKRKLHSLLESRFELDPGTADQLIAAATLVEGEAVDLYHFTSVIMRSVDEEGRLRIIEMMWELVYVDGEVRVRGQRRLARGGFVGSVFARSDRSQASYRGSAIHRRLRRPGYRGRDKLTRRGRTAWSPRLRGTGHGEILMCGAAGGREAR